jgi:hypothetical protein
MTYELKPINKPDGPSATNQWSFFAFPTRVFVPFLAIPWLIYTTRTVDLFLVWDGLTSMFVNQAPSVVSFICCIEPPMAMFVCTEL